MPAQLDLQKEFEPNLTAWVKWPDGDFEVELKYLSVTAGERMLRDCQVREYRNHQLTERTDEERFRRKIADLVVNWRGLTAAKARKFVNLKAGTPDDAETPCNPEQKMFVLSNFYGFPTFVLDQAKELHQLGARREEEEIKNS